MNTFPSCLFTICVASEQSAQDVKWVAQPGWASVQAPSTARCENLCQALKKLICMVDFQPESLVMGDFFGNQPPKWTAPQTYQLSECANGPTGTEGTK